MLNILHVIKSLDPERGGPQMVATRLAAAQAGLGHELHVFTYASPDPTKQDKIDALFRDIPHGMLVNRHEAPPPDAREKLLRGHVRRLLPPLVRNADFVHIHGGWHPMLPLAARLVRRLGKPYTQATHGTFDPWGLEQKSLKKRIALALVYRRMLNGAAFLHLLNEDERTLIATLKLTCPMEVIPNGIFLEEFQSLPPTGTFHGAHPEISGQPFILFLSRLHYKKGLDVLADAFAEVAANNSDWRLVVAGPDDIYCPIGARQDFERRIAAHGLNHRAHLVGPQYGRDKLAALVDATCYCLPSRQEGFSIAIIEALACGKPVVITKNCHFPEVAEVGAGRITSLDAAKIAHALVEVMSSRALQESMGHAGRALVAERFTWPQIARKSIEAYERALSRRLGA